eukprot:g310.t1
MSESVGHGLAGAVAGFLSTGIIHPISTVTLRQKLGYYVEGKIDLQELLSSVSRLYDGVGAQCLESFVYNGTNWGVYEYLKAWYGRWSGQPGALMPPVPALLVGCLAGLVTNPLTCPFKIVALQIQGSRNGGTSRKSDDKQPPTYSQAVQQVYNTNGLGGFWRGMVGAQLLVFDSSITFLAFERMRQSWLYFVGGAELSAVAAFMLGGFSKMVAVACTYPIRMAKESQQAQQKKGGQESIMAVWKKVYRQRSVKGRSGALAIFDGVGLELFANFVKYALRFAWKDQITELCMRIVGAR